MTSEYTLELDETERKIEIIIKNILEMHINSFNKINYTFRLEENILNFYIDILLHK